MTKVATISAGLKVALLGGTLLSSASYAQSGDGNDAAAQQDGINIIVVTAQKSAENVQNVPISISAFGSEVLIERSVTSVDQLSGVAPKVTLDCYFPFSTASSVLASSIRGSGSNEIAFKTDQGEYV